MRKISHVKSYSRGWWFLSLLIHPLSWHCHRPHSHLHRPGNHCHCPMPAVQNLPPCPAPHQPLQHLPLSPASSTSQQGAPRVRQTRSDPSHCCPGKVALVLQLSTHISLISLCCINTSSFLRRICGALTPFMLSLTMAWPFTVFAMLFNPKILPLFLSTEWQPILVSGWAVHSSSMYHCRFCWAWAGEHSVTIPLTRGKRAPAGAGARLPHSTSAGKQLRMHSSQSWGTPGTLDIINTLVRYSKGRLHLQQIFEKRSFWLTDLNCFQ